MFVLYIQALNMQRSSLSKPKNERVCVLRAMSELGSDGWKRTEDAYKSLICFHARFENYVPEDCQQFGPQHASELGSGPDLIVASRTGLTDTSCIPAVACRKLLLC